MSERKKFILDNDLKVNMSTLFLVPMLGFSNDLLTDEFIGAYIGEELDIKLIFENSDNEELKDIIWVLSNNGFYKSLEYDDDNKELIMSFSIPSVYDIDFNLLLTGKYSKFSNELKEVLLDYHGRKTGEGKCIYMVDALMPDFKTKRYRADKLGVDINDLPGGEVMSIPNMDNERYIRVGELIKQNVV